MSGSSLFSLDNPDLTPGERSMLQSLNRMHWQSKVEKEEEDGVLLVAYGGKDPKTGPMVKVRPHTNNAGNRIIGVDICFVDRADHKKDFNVFVGAEEFWPLCNDISNGAFFVTLENEAKKSNGNPSPKRYNYKAGKRDEDGKGGGALQAGFCLSKFEGFICVHGYNGKTSANFNVPATQGNLQMMAYMFLTLFDIADSAKKRLEAAVKNRLEHGKDKPEPEPDIDDEPEIPQPHSDPEPEIIELKGTVKAGNPESVDGAGNHYFLAETADGNQIVVKFQKKYNFTAGQTFTFKGYYTSEKCNVRGTLIPSFMVS